MGRLALIAGHSLLGTEPLSSIEPVRVRGEGGEVQLLDLGTHVQLQRHTAGGEYRTAARLDHRANLTALAAAGCDRILAIGSCGSLREELPVGSHVCPDDFIALQLGLSLYPDHRGERIPGFDPVWRGRVAAAWREAGGAELHDGGVYWQAIGPRFETPAEIRLIAAHADVIGMTIAAECIVAGELGIPYAAVCIVDNLANGVGEGQLSVEEFEAGKQANRERLLELLGSLVGEVAEEPGA
jgi:5'-methylthioadenosine phosphorylase